MNFEEFCMLVNGLNDNEGWVYPKICRSSDRKSWFMSTEISLPDQVNSNQNQIKNQSQTCWFCQCFILVLSKSSLLKFQLLNDSNIDIQRPSRGGDEGDPFATFRSSAEDTLGAVGGAVGSMASGKDDPVGDGSLRNDEDMIKIMTWMWHCKNM